MGDSLVTPLRNHTAARYWLHLNSLKTINGLCLYFGWGVVIQRMVLLGDPPGSWSQQYPAVSPHLGWLYIFLLPWRHGGAGGWLCSAAQRWLSPALPTGSFDEVWQPRRAAWTPCQTFFFLLHVAWLNCNPRGGGRLRMVSERVGTVWVCLQCRFSFVAALRFNSALQRGISFPSPLSQIVQMIATYS